MSFSWVMHAHLYVCMTIYCACSRIMKGIYHGRYSVRSTSWEIQGNQEPTVLNRTLHILMTDLPNLKLTEVSCYTIIPCLDSFLRLCASIVSWKPDQRCQQVNIRWRTRKGWFIAIEHGKSGEISLPFTAKRLETARAWQRRLRRNYYEWQIGYEQLALTTGRL